MILDFTKGKEHLRLKVEQAARNQRLASIRKDWPSVFANPTALALMLMSREAQDGMA